MRTITAIAIIGILVLIFICGYQRGVASVKPLPPLADSVIVAVHDTVTKDSVAVRWVYKYDTLTKHDTVTLAVPVVTRDSMQTATLDTTMRDSAHIRVTLTAGLIKPPARYDLDYQAPPRIIERRNVPMVEFKNDWRTISAVGAICAAAGLVAGTVFHK